MRLRLIGLAATISLAGALVALVGPSATTIAHASAANNQDQVVFVAGDIARGPVGSAAAAGTAATGQLIHDQMAANPGAHVLMLGDGAYPSGALTPDYQTYYGSTGWGEASTVANTYAVPGNHDYGQNELRCTTGEQTPGVTTAAPGTPGCDTTGFDTYFKGPLTQLPYDSPPVNNENQGWWSTTLGAWHLVGLNWSCEQDPTGCAAAGNQGTWLSKDLAAHPTPCTLALWHGAPFFSANGSDIETARGPSIDNKTDPYWTILQQHGADLVLAGHQHQYERFDHMSDVDPAGAKKGTGEVDPAGMREFVVGTGGGDPGIFEPNGTSGGTPEPQGGYPVAGIQAAGSQFALAGNFGVLKLVLHDGSYDWSFISAGAGNTNAGTVGEMKAGQTGNITPVTVAPAGTVLDSGTDTCHDPNHLAGTVSTSATSGTTSPTGGTSPTGTTSPSSTTGPSGTPSNASGYWMVESDGVVHPFGAARNYGNGPPSPGAKTVSIAPSPSGKGYWVLDSAGVVQAFGDAKLAGQPATAGWAPGEVAASLSPTPDGAGYWVFTSRGRAVPVGDAQFYKDMSSTPLNGPVLGSNATPSGHGYYMVGSDGGIFSFGDAVFHGSMGGRPLNKPVVGMVPFADGYLMVGADGGIFNFSTARFYGSLGANPPPSPIVAVAALG